MEGAIQSLHPSLARLDLLGGAQVRQLAPVVLGPKGYQHYQHELWASWREFRDRISEDLGLS